MITEKTLISLFKRRKVINKVKYRGRYVFPRIHEASFLYMKTFREKPLASISYSIREINKFNAAFKKNCWTDKDLVLYTRFGLTYSVTIDAEVLQYANKHFCIQYNKDTNKLEIYTRFNFSRSGKETKN